MEKTRDLEMKRRDKSQAVSVHFQSAEEMTLSQIIPLVEQRYAKRLSELKELLKTLSTKIQQTNQRNRVLLENSLDFVDRCLKVLVDNPGNVSYNPHGALDNRSPSLYQGTG